ncbi:MAG: hypothetical protein ABI760_14800 [Ferruginibacter sp.]
MVQNIKSNRIEILLQVLLWVAISYVANSLTKVSENFEQNINGTVISKIIVRSAFPLSLVTIACMLLLFYSNILWLLKLILRWKSLFFRLSVIIGWTLLLFLTDYCIVSALLPQNGIR